MSSFRTSPRSNSSSVIHSLGFLVTSSIFQLTNFLHGLVLQSPVVSSNFPKISFHASIVSLYILDFVLASSII